MAGPFVVIDHPVCWILCRRQAARKTEDEEEDAEEGEQGGVGIQRVRAREVDADGETYHQVGANLGRRKTVGKPVGCVLVETVIGRRVLVLLNLLLHGVKIIRGTSYIHTFSENHFCPQEHNPSRETSHLTDLGGRVERKAI